MSLKFVDSGPGSGGAAHLLAMVADGDLTIHGTTVTVANSPDTQRMLCTCAPVSDYTGREVARVGVFAHAADEGQFGSTSPRAAWELARLISMRLGHLPATAAMAV